MPDRAQDPPRASSPAEELSRDPSEASASEGAGLGLPPDQVLLEAFQAVPDLVATTTAQGDLVWINPAGRELLGLDVTDDLDTVEATDLYDPEALPHVVESIQPALEASGFWRGRTVLQPQEGQPIPVEATFVAHRGQAGQVTHHTAVMRDLREEEHVRAEQARLADIFEASPDVVITGRPNGTVLSINPVGRRILGLDADDPPPEEWRSFIPEGELALVEDEVIPQALECGHWSGEVALLTPGGEQVPFHATVVAHGEPGDGDPYLSASLHDLRARQAARGALERFWEVSPQLLAIASTDARFLDLNPAWEDVLGWDRDQLTAQPFLAFVHPDDREPTHAAMQALRDGGTVEGFENRYQAADGTYRWLRWTATMGEDSQAIYATATDVTDETRVETENARRRERLTRLVDVQQRLTTGDLALEEAQQTVAEAAQELTGADGAVLELVEGGEMVYAAATGSVAEHVGLRLDVDDSLSGTCYTRRELIDCPDAAQDPRVDAEAVERLGIRSMVLVPLVDKEVCHGVLKVLDEEPHAFVAEDIGLLQLVSGLLSAVLARSLAFEALESSEQRFRQIAETLDTVLWINKPDFSEVLYVNPAYERVWGRPASDHDVDPVAWMEGIHLDDIDEVAARLHAWDADGDPLSLSFRIQRPDGEIRRIEAEGFPVRGPDGRVTKVVGLAKDVTELHILQDQAVSQARQRARAEELEQILHISSHQLRTPIRQINSFSQMLEDRLADELDQGQDELLGYVRQGALDLQAMVEDLVTYAEVVGHQAPTRPVETGRAVERAIDRLADRIEATGAQITCQDLPRVQADPWQLRHLFEEILENALIFNKGPPTVRVTAQPAEEDRWQISIEDDGIGFEPRHTSRVTRMFERLHAPGEYEGVGMGLAICQRILERHGSPLEIESLPGRGTTVRFTLPAADRALDTPSLDG